MSVAVDTNVIVDIVGGDPVASKRAADALSRQGAKTGLVISPIVFAELFAHPGWRPREIQAFLKATAIAIDWEIAAEVWSHAGEAFRSYAERRSRDLGAPRRLLADFLIGAHAARIGALITSDSRFYRTNFPELKVVDLVSS